MTRPRPARLLLLLSSLVAIASGAGLSAGCGSGGGAADAGPPVDARHLADAAQNRLHPGPGVRRRRRGLRRRAAAPGV